MTINATPKCPVCSNYHTRELRSYRSSHSIFNFSSLYSCDTCTLVFAYPPPSHSELDKYNRSYFCNAHSGLPNSEDVLAFHAGLAHLRKDYISTYLSNGEHSVRSVLEIGPGVGYLSRCWLDQFPTHQYFAFETDDDCRKILKSQGVVCDACPPKHSIDLVIASHVVEHLSDPINFLDEITDYIRPGGCLFVEVPCQDHLYKSSDEPHLLFFNDDSIQHLLKKLGFVDIQTAYYGRKLSSLKKPFSSSFLFNKLRSRIAMTSPFGSFLAQIKFPSLDDPLQKAVLLPYQPHIKSNKPAWWLRVMASLP